MAVLRQQDRREVRHITDNRRCTDQPRRLSPERSRAEENQAQEKIQQEVRPRLHKENTRSTNQLTMLKGLVVRV